LILAIPLAGSHANKNSIPNLLKEINDKTILQISIENLISKLKSEISEIVVIVNEDDDRNFKITNIIKQIDQDKTSIVKQNGLAKGAVCSLLLSQKIISGDEELIIANANQILNCDLLVILNKFRDSKAICGIPIFNSLNPNWSYVNFDSTGQVVEVSEKVTISKNAIAGFYYFNSTQIFRFAALESIKKQRTHNDLFYTSLVINELILKNYFISTFKLNDSDYYPLNSDERIQDYKKFLNEN
jgi:choline kinase